MQKHDTLPKVDLDAILNGENVLKRFSYIFEGLRMVLKIITIKKTAFLAFLCNQCHLGWIVD